MNSATNLRFSDSIGENLDTLRELLSGIPPGARNRARLAAVEIEKVFDKLRKEYPRDPAVALGTAFAIFTLADRMTDAPPEGEKNLIQLLS